MIERVKFPSFKITVEKAPMREIDGAIFYLAPCLRCGTGMFDSRKGVTHNRPDCDLELVRKIMES
jgi:exosome complex RNA-binding protein Csl4